ncbi:hypothetical protein R6Q59_010343 [Mikania micrantha]
MDEKEPEDDLQGSLTDLVKNTTAMKDDVAAIKAQTDEKEPEDAPQDPLTDLIMEVNNGGSPVSGVVKVLESDTLEVLEEKYAGETQINKAEQLLMKCDPKKIPKSPLISVIQVSFRYYRKSSAHHRRNQRFKMVVAILGFLNNYTTLDFVVFLILISRKW